MRQIIWTAWFAMLMACEIPDEVQAEMACTTVCTCFSDVIDKDGCIGKCIEESGFGMAPEDCFECIQAHANACSTLLEDCDSLCERPRPPEEGDPPDGGMR